MNKPLKLLIICPYFYEPHRWMISAYKTALYLSKTEPVVVLTTGSPSYERINDNLVVYRMWDWFMPDPINYSIVPGLAWHLFKVIRKERPTHFMVNKYMFFTSFSILFLRLMGKKVIAVTDTYPGLNWFPRAAWLGVIITIYSRIIGMPLLKISTKVVLLHEGLIDIAKQYHLRYQVVHNGVDLEQIDATKPNRELKKPEMITITYVGRLESVKGYDDILAVAQTMIKKHSNVRFVLAGSTHGKEELVKSLAGDQLMFLGHRSDVISIMKASDIFVLASYSEGLPNAVMEAMACGLPCVCSNVGAIPYLIKDGQSGLLFDPGDQQALQKQLERCIDDARLRSRLGASARKTIEQHYSWSNIAKQYEHLLDQVGPS